MHPPPYARVHTDVMLIIANARQLHFHWAGIAARWIMDVRFVDGEGRGWVVREVSDPTLAMIPPHLLAQPEFASGWLLFETSGEKRRLAPYPDDWATLPVTQLEAHCRRAKRIEPVAAGSHFSPVARAAEHARL
jgi:hypothetical protein